MEDATGTVELKLAAVATHVPTARRAVVRLAEQVLAPSAVSAVALAVTEACASVVLAAYRGSRDSGVMIVRARPVGEDELVVAIYDRGTPIARRHDLPGERFRMRLLRTLARVETVERGALNCVSLRFPRAPR